jgi:hypothetical protein
MNLEGVRTCDLCGLESVIHGRGGRPNKLHQISPWHQAARRLITSDIFQGGAVFECVNNSVWPVGTTIRPVDMGPGVPSDHEEDELDRPYMRCRFLSGSGPWDDSKSRWYYFGASDLKPCNNAAVRLLQRLEDGEARWRDRLDRRLEQEAYVAGGGE